MPTNTPTNTPIPPTATNTATRTPTNTPIPPTATNTATRTPTNTAVPATATSTVSGQGSVTPIATNTQGSNPSNIVVGGIGSFADPSDPSLAAGSSEPGGDHSTALAIGVTVGALMLGASAWYVRRRYLR